MGVAAFAAALLFFNLHILGSGSSLMSAEAPAATMTFVGECMSAETLARQAAGQAMTPEDRAALRKTCDAAFNRGKPTEAMLAIREGRLVAGASQSRGVAGGGF
jgi:uncharacterized membrane protein